jgi:NAD(P)-dependent dehydrogenase (short-subunit alcohol dehydrogenase family)
VVAVEPGAIETPMWDKGSQDDWSAAASQQNLALYGEAYRAFRRFSEQTAAGAISCDAVSRAIFHALTAKTPRARYLVGTDARVYGRLAQICPTRVLDWLTRKVMGLGRARSPQTG